MNAPRTSRLYVKKEKAESASPKATARATVPRSTAATHRASSTAAKTA